MSLMVAAMLMAGPADGGTAVYRCRNEASGQEFVLSFVETGLRAEQVRLFVDGVPRLALDNVTAWRGTINEDGVTFRYRERRRGVFESGNMSMVWTGADRSTAELTWSSATAGGHIVLEDGQHTAICRSLVLENVTP